MAKMLWRQIRMVGLIGLGLSSGSLATAADGAVIMPIDNTLFSPTSVIAAYGTAPALDPGVFRFGYRVGAAFYQESAVVVTPTTQPGGGKLWTTSSGQLAPPTTGWSKGTKREAQVLGYNGVQLRDPSTKNHEVR